MSRGAVLDLVGSLLTRATQPRDNPVKPEASRCAVALLAHDYPARTPAMWNACYGRFGMDCQSVALICRAADLEAVLVAARVDPGFVGGGLGVGLKSEGLPLLDEIDPRARPVGSVNVIQKTAEGRLVGHDTDGEGYVRSLQRHLGVSRDQDLGGFRVLMLGAGGTARAVALALARREAEIVVLNRTAARARELATAVNQVVGRPLCRGGGEDRIRSEAPTADVIVNVSTKGAAGPLEQLAALAPAPLPATEEEVEANLEESRAVLASVSSRTVISEVVLRYGPTPTLALAEERGLSTHDALGMVVHQGAEAFFLVHGDELDRQGVTRDAVVAEMERAVS